MNGESQHSLSRIMTDVASDENISSEVRVKLLKELSQIPTPLQSDKWIYRLVVVFLGGAVTMTLIGGFVLKYKSAADLPEGLLALGSAAVGALAGLLAPSPSR